MYGISTKRLSSIALFELQGDRLFLMLDDSIHWNVVSDITIRFSTLLYIPLEG
jgi:hypothetical protein